MVADCGRDLILLCCCARLQNCCASVQVGTAVAVAVRAEIHCSPPIWIWVSEDFSEIDLLQAVITQAEEDSGEIMGKKVLEPMLYEIAKGKRSFVVLDDVWDAQVWERLLYKPLHSCSAGSRVLVTTKKKK